MMQKELFWSSFSICPAAPKKESCDVSNISQPLFIQPDFCKGVILKQIALMSF